MIAKLWKYFLATRPIESSLMIGFPLIGTMIALPAWQGVGWLVIKFFIATYPLVMYVYCLNSFGGIEHDRLNYRLNENPAVTGEVTPAELKWLAQGGAFVSGLLYFFWFPYCLLPWLLIIANWTLYSHPRIYAKAWPVFGTTLHFIGGVLQVLLGYAAVQPTGCGAILIAVYFSLVFSAGHLNHEVKDHDPDRAAGLLTNAVVFGPERMFSIAFGVFTFAFVYLLVLAVAAVLPWRLALPYLAIYPFHYVLHRRATTGGWRGYDRTYQMIYRALFLLAGLVLVLTQFWTLPR